MGALSHQKFELMVTKHPFCRTSRSKCNMNLKPKLLLEMITMRDITDLSHKIPLVSDFGNYCPLKLRFQICTYSTR